MTRARAADLLKPAGPCCHCKQHAEERIAVDYVERASGPAGEVLGCLPCARSLLRWGTGHPWLAQDLAAIDRERKR
ncbi:hypothetical protein LHJ74_09995 [Streptomyces sp. N2-109]|uniref:Deoxyxylulose-5-phosphate synthase n=1 Tax=Streptomyces gossypii TaxID=2883101 RepID=A0ABT2JRW7_9ACTN|nr:hypothetical protein [Streptomyces gossypii]MCT2590239.1 hypothetical protein [Streptomyces gossypii]